MAGLLGTSWDDPRTMGLLGVAASLLQSSGSSPRPIGLGEALGRAMGVGMGTYSQSLDAQAQRAALQQTAKLREMQIKAAEQEAADTQWMRDTARQFYRSPVQQALQAGGGPTNAAAAALPNAQGGFDMPGFLEALSQRDPLLALKVRQSMQQAPIKLGEGDTLLDPTTYKPLAQGQPKPEAVPELTRLLSQLEKLPEGHPWRAIYEQQIAKITTHAPAAQQNVYTGTLVPAEVGGRQAFVMPGKDGSVKVVEGVQPAGTAAAADKATARRQAAMNRAQIVLGKIDSALGKVGMMTAGIGGSLLSGVPGSSAYDLRAEIDTIKANIGFQELQQMRDMSPTGGALGQVAVQELNMLQAVLSSLDANQSPDQLRANLQSARKHYQNWLDIVTQAGQAGQGATQQGVGSPSVDDLLKKYGQ